MTVKWNSEVLEKYIAPGIDKFTSAEIPDLTDNHPEASHWLTNHFLNSALRLSFKDQWRQVVIGYLRRAHNAFRAYHDARMLTYEYLDGNDPHNPRVGRYYDVVSRWEDYALQISMAIELFKWLNQGEGAFVKNDGSKEQRLYEIANLVKHTAKAVNSGQCQDTDVLPLWLCNEGLCSFGVNLSFIEASDVLTDVATLADDYQDPMSLKEKWTKQD